jgi:hypothetical protein
MARPWYATKARKLILPHSSHLPHSILSCIRIDQLTVVFLGHQPNIPILEVHSHSIWNNGNKLEYIEHIRALEEKQANNGTLHGELHFGHSLLYQLCEEVFVQPCSSAESGRYSTFEKR